MNECIAVIKTPSKCSKCIFCGNSKQTCMLNGYTLTMHKFERRMNWCPLKEIPDRKPELQMDIIHSESIECGYYDGWNACIDEIVGGK